MAKKPVKKGKSSKGGNKVDRLKATAAVSPRPNGQPGQQLPETNREGAVRTPEKPSGG